MPLRILIMDDSELTRALRRTLLRDNGGFEVIGEASDGPETFEITRKLLPDAIIIDPEMRVSGECSTVDSGDIDAKGYCKTLKIFSLFHTQ